MSLLEKIIEDRNNDKNFANENNKKLSFEEFRYFVNIARATHSDIGIKIEGGIEQKLKENIYSVYSLIKSAKKIIRIYSDTISDSIYGRAGLMGALDDWLSENKDRRIKILLKKKEDINNTEFYKHLYQKHEDKIELKTCTIPNIENCKKNVAIFDDNKFKIKFYESNSFSDDKETILVSFNSPAEGQELIKEFDSIYNNNLLAKKPKEVKELVTTFDQETLQGIIRSISEKDPDILSARL